MLSQRLLKFVASAMRSFLDWVSMITPRMTFATIIAAFAIADLVDKMPSLFSKLRRHRDDDHQKSRPRKDCPSVERGSIGGSLDPSTSLIAKVNASNVPAPSPSPSEQLWNTAYDQLKQKDDTLVGAYETILSQALHRDDLRDKPLQNMNAIEQNDASKRRNQMDILIQAGLAKTEKEAKIKQSVGEVPRKILLMKDIVSSAVQAIPQAALAWTGVCFVLQVSLHFLDLSNSIVMLKDLHQFHNREQDESGRFRPRHWKNEVVR